MGYYGAFFSFLHLHGVAMVPDTCIALPEIVTSLSAGELRLKRKNKTQPPWVVVSPAKYVHMGQ